MMTYYEYITQFAEIEHPFGDLGIEIRAEVGASKKPDELLDMYEGDSFADIYNHFIEERACDACLETFIESWVAWKKAEKEAMSDPLPAMILYQLSKLNEGLVYMQHLEEISDSLAVVSDSTEKIGKMLFNMMEHRKSYSALRIAGKVDTYEQN